MQTAVVSANGQIVIPNEIVQKLGISIGDTVCVYKKDDGLIIKPTQLNPFKTMQEFMKGEADKVGLKSEDDVMEWMSEVRKEFIDERNQPT